MKMKLYIRICLTTSIILLICFAPFIADAQLFDGQREGLIIGGGVGYAAVAAGEYGSASGFTTTGRIGYGVSDQLSIYISSDILSVFPRVGVAYFLNSSSPYFLQGALGYTSVDDDNILSIVGGGGYEVSKHLTLELLLGFNRLSETYTSSINIFTGATTTETSESNFTTIAFTFNYYFY